MTVREITPDDKPELVELWTRVFGDPECYVEAFFRLLPEIGSGVAAFEDGELCGAAYVITAGELVEGGKTRRCGYLYAVAVEPEARGCGIGGALSRAAAELGRSRGAELICTRPAEPGLFAWYERELGLRCALLRERRELDSRPGLMPAPLDAAEYGRRREALLRDRPHLRLPEAALLLEEANCVSFGGGLYALGNGIAAAYINDGVTEIRELLGASEEEAAALGAALGTERVRLWLPAAQGDPYLAFAPADLPPDTVWNLAFD
ncbi:MAG: GNAT family N-acetyltransferase [Oscillospiraceae bacterium]|nr:GNAT family N-acetyltransferase [Oscillospiraceae bacterium]